MVTIAKFKVGDTCRCLHHYAYRANEPFTIVSIATFPTAENARRILYLYIVQYDDGVLDAVPVENEGGYIMEKIKRET